MVQIGRQSERPDRAGANVVAEYATIHFAGINLTEIKKPPRGSSGALRADSECFQLTQTALSDDAAESGVRHLLLVKKG